MFNVEKIFMILEIYNLLLGCVEDQVIKLGFDFAANATTRSLERVEMDLAIRGLTALFLVFELKVDVA